MNSRVRNTRKARGSQRRKGRDDARPGRASFSNDDSVRPAVSPGGGRKFLSKEQAAKHRIVAVPSAPLSP
jgi:hypothetical protein